MLKGISSPQIKPIPIVSSTKQHFNAHPFVKPHPKPYGKPYEYIALDILS